MPHTEEIIVINRTYFMGHSADEFIETRSNFDVLFLFNFLGYSNEFLKNLLSSLTL